VGEDLYVVVVGRHLPVDVGVEHFHVREAVVTVCGCADVRGCQILHGLQQDIRESRNSF
jgi:hypothetical protein